MYYGKKKNNFLGIFIIIVFLIIIVAILLSLVNILNTSYLVVTEDTEETGTEAVANEFDIENLMKNSIYSVVGISKLNDASTSIFIENSEEKLGIGSGIIVTSNGYILANQSVVGEVGSSVYVTFKNGDKYVAEVVWTDSRMDIAIIKIATNNLITLGFGNSDSVNLGEDVYMISNPNGYDFNQKLQAGIISEIDKTYKIVNDDNTETYIEDVIKINSTIESSQTGSPILNSSGELIGITSSKLDSVIPINRVKNIIQKFKQEEEFSEAYLGVYGFDYNVIQYLNSNIEIESGVYIEQISEDSPAIDLIESGDIIRAIDGEEIFKMQELVEYLYSKNKGDAVILDVLRGTEELEVTIVLN